MGLCARFTHVCMDDLSMSFHQSLAYSISQNLPKTARFFGLNPVWNLGVFQLCSYTSVCDSAVTKGRPRARSLTSTAFSTTWPGRTSCTERQRDRQFPTCFLKKPPLFETLPSTQVPCQELRKSRWYFQTTNPSGVPLPRVFFL